MDLALHQRKLLELLRGAATIEPSHGAYLNTVARSRDLEEARRNIFLWRLWVLERTSVLTFRLLTRMGLVEQAVENFIAGSNISPFRETQAPAFLESLSVHEIPLVRAVASFELALIKVKDGDDGAYAIDWPCDPSAILHALARHAELPSVLAPGDYRTVVARSLPGCFLVEEPPPCHSEMVMVGPSTSAASRARATAIAASSK